MNFFSGLVLATVLQGNVSTLQGNVQSTDCLGVVGIRVSGSEVIKVHSGTPAATSGLQARDKILYVNGQKKNLELDGEPDKPVHVIFKRAGLMYEVVIIRKCVYELPQLNPSHYGKNKHHEESGDCW